MNMALHIKPDEKDIKANKIKEPEGEKIRAALIRFIKRHKIVSMYIDTSEHTISMHIVELPPKIKPVLTHWGSIYVKDTE